MMEFVVVIVVSAALVLGAIWGIYGALPQRLEGFIVALAGGALMISVVLELVQPAIERVPLVAACAVVLLGSVVFVALDYLIKKKSRRSGGTGLLVAITLDGVPESLALGVALIGTPPMQVAALAGSILLSNLPEAAGGAKQMVQDGRSKGKVLALWSATGAILAGAALAGNIFLAETPRELLEYIRCFAGGAVAASLSTEVFPKAFKDGSYLVGIATAIGLTLAIALTNLG